MQRPLPLALGCGITVGSGVYGLLAAHWYLAAGTAAVYAGATYFLLAFETGLFSESVSFSDRQDKLGYAVGLFGLCVSPLALAEQFGEGELVIVVWVLGLIAFLQLAQQAARE
jgi:hypothetical protein